MMNKLIKYGLTLGIASLASNMMAQTNDQTPAKKQTRAEKNAEAVALDKAQRKDTFDCLLEKFVHRADSSGVPITYHPINKYIAQTDAHLTSRTETVMVHGKERIEKPILATFLYNQKECTLSLLMQEPKSQPYILYKASKEEWDGNAKLMAEKAQQTDMNSKRKSVYVNGSPTPTPHF